MSNFSGALQVAGHFKIPEVTVYFNKKLFRGNRVRKIDTNSFDTFSSPMFPPLATFDVGFDFKWDLLMNLNEENEDLNISTELGTNISTYRV